MNNAVPVWARSGAPGTLAVRNDPAQTKRRRAGSRSDLRGVQQPQLRRVHVRLRDRGRDLPPPHTLWLSGTDALRQYYGPRFAANPNARGTSIARIVHGRYIVDHDRVTGSSTGADRTVVWIYEIADGTIIRAWVLP